MIHRHRNNTRLGLGLVTVMALGGRAQTDSTAPLAFGVGERIEYHVKYGVMAGGSAWQEIVGVETMGGRTAYHIVSEARTNKSFDVFHKVRERHDSWWDVEHFSSLKFVTDARQGSYRNESESWVQGDRLLHTYQTKKHKGQTDVEAPAGLQDSLSLVYFLRTRPLALGQEYEIPLESGGEVHRITVAVTGRETVRVPSGKYSCFHIEPRLSKDTDKIKIEVWLTADDRRVPVQLKSKLPVGSFVAKMTHFSEAKTSPQSPLPHAPQNP